MASWFQTKKLPQSLDTLMRSLRRSQTWRFEMLKSLNGSGTGDKAIAKKGYTKIIVEAKGKVVLGKGLNPSAFIVPAVPFFTTENSTIVK
jgi:hypothetical protein